MHPPSAKQPCNSIRIDASRARAAARPGVPREAYQVADGRTRNAGAWVRAAGWTAPQGEMGDADLQAGIQARRRDRAARTRRAMAESRPPAYRVGDRQPRGRRGRRRVPRTASSHQKSRDDGDSHRQRAQSHTIVTLEHGRWFPTPRSRWSAAETASRNPHGSANRPQRVGTLRRSSSRRRVASQWCSIARHSSRTGWKGGCLGRVGWPALSVVAGGRAWSGRECGSRWGGLGMLPGCRRGPGDVRRETYSGCVADPPIPCPTPSTSPPSGPAPLKVSTVRPSTRDQPGTGLEKR